MIGCASKVRIHLNSLRASAPVSTKKLGISKLIEKKKLKRCFYPINGRFNKTRSGSTWVIYGIQNLPLRLAAKCGMKRKPPCAIQAGIQA